MGIGADRAPTWLALSLCTMIARIFWSRSTPLSMSTRNSWSLKCCIATESWHVSSEHPMKHHVVVRRSRSFGLSTSSSWPSASRTRQRGISAHPLAPWAGDAFATTTPNSESRLTSWPLNSPFTVTSSPIWTSASASVVASQDWTSSQATMLMNSVHCTDTQCCPWTWGRRSNDVGR